MDLGGYYEISSAGYRYFLIIINDYTCYIWVWFLKSKDMKSTSAVLKEFKAYAKNQFKCKIKRFQSDNSTSEFLNQEWRAIIIEAGIQHEPSPLNNQDKNGVA